MDCPATPDPKFVAILRGQMPEYQYIEITDVSDLFPERKTHTWEVTNKSSGAYLGIIEWYSAWRQYCYTPGGDYGARLIFSASCLDDISGFIKMQMQARLARVDRSMK